MNKDVARFFWHVIEQLPVSERQACLDSLLDDEEEGRFLAAVHSVMPANRMVAFAGCYVTTKD